MAGTPNDPFLESAAKCTFCLDFNASYLRRQWRRFGRLPCVDVPYGFTLAKLGENLDRSDCKGCRMVLEAAQHISREFNIDFRNATFQYLDKDGLRGLSLSLSLLHPLHASDALLEIAQSSRDMKTRRVTAPSENDPSRITEHSVSSPDYEIFLSSERDSNPPAHDATPYRTGLLSSPSRCGDTGSVAAAQWAMAQIKYCCTHHLLCESGNTNSKLPTRVLDLGEDLSQYTASPKLYETSHEQAEYVCLSHCWGGSVPIETTRSTLEAFKEQIPWEHLPRTFQDAIVFTRRLGIRFLWIDSLCIIQHDADDWFIEAGRMASIYEHAKVTLAAAASSNSSGGLFRQARPEKCLNIDEGIWMRQLPNPDFFKEPGKVFRGSGDASPLLKRAWVFQERLLSRRILHFTPLELVMECRVAKVTESGHDWIDASVKHDFSAVYDEIRDSNKLSSVAMWQLFVESFTRLGLTKASDTLPAIAGLAKRVCRVEGPEHSYLAGLWRHDLLSNLLWVRSSRDMCRVNKDVPTWSWARTDAAKSFNTMQVPLCEVLEAECISSRKEKDVFVHVDGGHLLLSGFLIPAVAADSGVIVDGVPRISHVVKPDYHWHTPPEPEPCIKNDRLFFLPIGASVGGNIIDFSIAALVLREDRDSDGSEKYRRVGAANMNMEYLRPYDYIIGEEELLASHLKSQIALGESVLSDGRYKFDDGRKPLWLRGQESSPDHHLQNAAYFEYLSRYGGKKPQDMTFAEFFGQPHLDILKERLEHEQNRLRECRRRSDKGEQQVNVRRVIQII